MKAFSAGDLRRRIRRAGAFAAAMLLLASALFLFGCSDQQKPGQTVPSVYVENGQTVYEDSYVYAKLPGGYFVAVDNTKNMGSAYHAYLMFKHESDFSGSQIVYYSMRMKAEVYENMQTSREQVEAQLIKSYASKGLPIEIVAFLNITQENCKGYIVEYKTSSNGHDMTQIIFNAVASNGEFVNFTFDCADEGLLESMRAAAQSIQMKTN